jgi:hypothetical protein
MAEDNVTATCCIFQTAFQIARLNCPMTDLPALTDLQEACGLEVRLILESNHTCTDICHFTDSEMQLL